MNIHAFDLKMFFLSVTYCTTFPSTSCQVLDSVVFKFQAQIMMMMMMLVWWWWWWQW